MTQIVLDTKGAKMYTLGEHGIHELKSHGSFQFWNIRRLCNLAAHYRQPDYRGRVTIVWIVKGCGLWKNIHAINEPSGNWPQFWNSDGWEVRPAVKWQAETEPLQRNVLTAWNGDGFRCKLVFTGLYDNNWAFDEIEDPYVLFNALNEFKERLGIEPTFKFETARTLFENTLKPKSIKEFWDDAAEYWRPFIEQAEPDILWSRAPKKDEKHAAFCHAFDKRSMYLAAARSVFVGTGPYTVLENVDLKTLIASHKKLAGLVEFASPIKWNDPFLAELFGKQKRFYWPLVELFYQADDFQKFPKIKKAWIWPEPVRLFEKFAGQLLDAIKQGRADSVDSDGEPVESVRLAVACMKSLYTGLFGWFGRLNVPAAKAHKAELFRPDWRGHIVAMAKANLLRNIYQVRQWTNGREPFGIYHDCLMYFSDGSDPVFDFNGSDLLYENKFTHEGTIPAAEMRKLIKAEAGIVEMDKAFKGVTNG